MSEYAKNIQTIEDMWKKRIELPREGGRRMSEYIIKVDEDYERWHYVEQQYTHFFGYPITDEIVRCRDCVFFEADVTTFDEYGSEIETGNICAFTGLWINPEDFCVWGERE